MGEYLSHVPYEQLLTDFAIPLLEQGRQGWDVPHTKVVRYHANQLASEISNDPRLLQPIPFDSLKRILISSAWLHDIGYQPALHTSMETIKADKAAHMVQGGIHASKFFQRPEVAAHYTAAEVAKIIYVVMTHDAKDIERDLIDTAFFQADTLGAYDIEGLLLNNGSPTITSQEARASIARAKAPGGRFTHFRTDYGKRKLQEVVPKYLNYLEHKDNGTLDTPDGKLYIDLGKFSK